MTAPYLRIGEYFKLFKHLIKPESSEKFVKRFARNLEEDRKRAAHRFGQS